MRILIAEDEAGIARALKVILEKNKFSTDIVYNGTDALDYILSTSYDAIVLDIMMPGLNGLEVLSRAREHGVKTPVMLLTAKGEISDRVAALKPARTTICPSPSPQANLLRVCALSPAGATPMRTRCFHSAIHGWIAAAMCSAAPSAPQA